MNDVDGDFDDDESVEWVDAHIDKTRGKANSSSSRKPDGSLEEKKIHLHVAKLEVYTSTFTKVVLGFPTM